MRDIKKIVCFDFDDTLCHTIKPEEGLKIWRDKFGTEWPHIHGDVIGWWSKPETLDLDIFDTKLNDFVHSAYLDAVADEDNLVICATGRLERLREEVTTILDKFDLKFDGVFLNRKGDTFRFKTELFKSMIEKHKPDEFIMYDDRESHLAMFEEWATTIDCKITIVDVVNKTTKVFE